MYAAKPEHCLLSSQDKTNHPDHITPHRQPWHHCTVSPLTASVRFQIPNIEDWLPVHDRSSLVDQRYRLGVVATAPSLVIPPTTPKVPRHSSTYSFSLSSGSTH